jgi:membrane dipeptidase
MTPPVVDAHSDLLLELDHRRDEDGPFAAHWLPQLQAGRVALQVCAVYCAQEDWLPERGLRQALQQIAAFHRAIDENPDEAFAVQAAADLDEAERGERVGLMLAMEGAEAFGHGHALVDVFWRLGLRMVSVTHNHRNAFGDGVAEPNPGGLSRSGRALVERLAERGFMLDLVHASAPTFADVLEHSGDAPVLVSHGACRAVYDSARNLSDDQLRKLAARDGVLGIMAVSLAVDPASPTIERMVDHVDHAASVMGIEHVGLGGDFFSQLSEVLGWNTGSVAGALASPAGESVDWAVEGLLGPAGYPLLLEALDRRGYTAQDVRRVAGGNFLERFRRVLPA